MKAFSLSRFALICMSLLFCFATYAQDKSEEQSSRFGVYEAIVMNRTIVHDVKVDKEGNVFLQLMPDYKDKEIIVKISNERFASYRTWWNGETELVSPANVGKAAYGWTDRVQTQSNYVEYWMDGAVFLHLMRMDRELK